MELRWALKERDIAAQVRWDKVISLNHETLRIGDMGAIAPAEAFEGRSIVTMPAATLTD